MILGPSLRLDPGGWAALHYFALLLLVLGIGLLIVHFVILVYEEPYLRSRFGTSYERYCQHVHRWIPGPPYRP